MKRETIKQAVKREGIEGAMRIPKGRLTHKQKVFAEAVALGETGADAYRKAYNTTARPKVIGNAASILRSHAGVALEIERIEQANELAALHSAEGLRSIVIATLTSIATDPEEKGATRVQAVRSIGQLVGVDAFRETKRIERVQDSGDIRKQILEQLRGITINSDTGTDSDVDSLLSDLIQEKSGKDDDLASSETPPYPDQPSDINDPPRMLHSIPHEQSQDFGEPPPIE